MANHPISQPMAKTFSVVDLVAAALAGRLRIPEFHGRNREPSLPFQRIADAIQDGLGFGLLDDDTLVRAVLARRGGNVTRDIRTEFSEHTREPRDFQGETPEQAYREGEQALYRAVRFLQESAGVPHFAFLPYRYLLVVLTRFFAHFPEPHPRNYILLVR